MFLFGRNEIKEKGIENICEGREKQIYGLFNDCFIEGYIETDMKDKMTNYGILKNDDNLETNLYMLQCQCKNCQTIKQNI